MGFANWNVMNVFDGDFLNKLQRLRFAFLRRQAAQGDGAAASLRGGGMIEFKDHKKYSPGDDYRSIDWNAYSRTGQLFVKEFAREESVLVHVVLDTSASMAAEPGKWKQALQLAAGLGFVGLCSKNRVQGWTAADGGVQSLATWTNEQQARAMCESLSRVNAAGETRLADSLQRLGATLPAGSVVYLISDFLDASESRRILQLLRGRRFAFALVQVLGESEWHPGQDGLVSFVDAESGETVSCLWDEHAMTGYLAALARLQEGWRSFAAQHSMRYHVVRRAESALDSLVRLGLEGGLRV